MVGIKDVRASYSEQMSFWKLGHALYEPLSTSEMKIGHCGYFDETETWNPIALLTDLESVTAAELTLMEAKSLRQTVDNSIQWGPKTSSNVKTIEAKLDLGVA
jgi:hypothetical protein